LRVRREIAEEEDSTPILGCRQTAIVMRSRRG